MNNKRPLGITLFALSMLYFPIGRGYVEWLMVGQLWQSSLLIQTINWHIITSLIPKIFTIVFLLVMIAGVFNLKRWGYYMLLSFSVFSIITKVFFVPSVIRYAGQKGALFDVVIIESVVTLIYSIILVFYFTRKQTACLYLGTDIREDISKNRWSLGLMLIGWVLLFLSVINFSKAIAPGFDWSLKSLSFGWTYWVVYFICSVGLLLKKEIIRKTALGLLGFSIFMAVISRGFSPRLFFYLIQYGLLIFFLTRPKVIGLFK